MGAPIAHLADWVAHMLKTPEDSCRGSPTAAPVRQKCTDTHPTRRILIFIYLCIYICVCERVWEREKETVSSVNVKKWEAELTPPRQTEMDPGELGHPQPKDLKPHILPISALPSQQENESGWGAHEQEMGATEDQRQRSADPARCPPPRCGKGISVQQEALGRVNPSMTQSHRDSQGSASPRPRPNMCNYTGSQKKKKCYLWYFLCLIHEIPHEIFWFWFWSWLY